MYQQNTRLYIGRYADASFFHLCKEIFRIFKAFFVPGKHTALDSFLCFDGAVTGRKLKAVYRDPFFFCGVNKFRDGIVTVFFQFGIVHGRTQIS